MRFIRLPVIVAFLLAAILPGVAAGEVMLSFNLRKADGTQAVYEFRVPSVLPAQPFVESVQAQHEAGVAALNWAKGFYQAHEVFLTSVVFKANPIPYYLATFDGSVGGMRQPFFAVVLGGNAVLEPVELQVVPR